MVFMTSIHSKQRDLKSTAKKDRIKQQLAWMINFFPFEIWPHYSFTRCRSKKNYLQAMIAKVSTKYVGSHFKI
jgi:hypothetical protein